MEQRAGKALGILRILLGWVFLWPFFDKTFGLGFATTADKAWVLGNSPTTGFLKFATSGPFAPLFQSLAENTFVDWLFMVGLLCIGLALILGVGMRIAAYTGSLLMILMWLATLPTEHNPIVDDHIVYAAALFVLYLGNAGEHMGLSKKWKSTKLVKQHPWLA